jgi:hypothetical protein
MSEVDYRRDNRGQNNRKRRYRGKLIIWIGTCLTLQDDAEDDFDNRRQRSRYEEPKSSRLRKELFSIAEYVGTRIVKILAYHQSYKRPAEEISTIAKTLTETFDDDEELRTVFLQAVISL